jgi:two-component system chemotaxis response regulator CheY
MTGKHPTETHLSHLSILLVEDDAFAMRLAQSVLKQLGIRLVICARDGAEALRVLNDGAQKFDLIISDWTMPKMSGLDLLKEVRKTLTQMPFLMLTGRATPDFVLEARKNGVDAYVMKPFSPDQLGKKIAAIFKLTV